jgi:predicted nucleic acid-binding protein
VIYIDTSCLLKIFRLEPDSSIVLAAVNREATVVVSVLAELEVSVQLKAEYLAGNLTLANWRRLEARFSVLRHQPQYDFRTLSGSLFQTALRQHRNSGRSHCRTLDRLHLAALEELGLTRLMTHDNRQAKAAVASGFEVVQPGFD